jgi:hypothetical protein
VKTLIDDFGFKFIGDYAADDGSFEVRFRVK